MNWKFLLLIGIILIVGCHETDSQKTDSTAETAVISCEAAHVTVETIRGAAEENDENE